MDDELVDLSPLLDVILEKVPPAKALVPGEALRAQVFNLGYDNFLGRLAVARIYDGSMKSNQQLFIKHEGADEINKGKIVKLSTFKGISKLETPEAFAGDIVMIAGFSDINIGDTLTDTESAEPLPTIAVDEPTIALQFMPNASPFAGREGKYVTSRQIRERLEKELEINVGLQVDFSQGDSFEVRGRGEMHIAILLENMRREGYELAVSQPQVIVKEIEGVKSEPFEEVTVDIPSEFQGAVIERLGNRAFVMTNMIVHGNQVRLMFEGPTRGLLGYKNQFIVDTKGEGILASRVLGFKPYAGEIKKRQVGSMISMVQGKALAFALFSLQDRGQLYIGAGTEVYEGMVIGNTSKGEEMTVNPTKGKQLTNMRASGTDEAVVIVNPRVITIEVGLEIMTEDEYLEITPHNVRLRKAKLTESERRKG
jgi:GTP-binding protein